MSHALLALLVGGSAAGFFYFKLSQRSLERTKPNLLGALFGGVIVFIIVYTLVGKLK